MTLDPPAEPASAPCPTEVVAIDGPSGSGKSTVARTLAQQLGFAFLDTGAMYRAITWRFLAEGCAPGAEGGDEARMRQVLAESRLALRDGRVVVDGRDVTERLRTREVEAAVSPVSALPFVRAAMRDLQRRIAAAGPVVAEGRDMCTVVFPRARWKVYLDASPAERARRRCQDFARQGRQVSEAEVLEEIVARDRYDSTREAAPLVRAPDAFYLDTTGLPLAAVVDRLLAFARGAGGPEDGGRS